MMKIDIPYYEDNTRISNSAIGWFLRKDLDIFVICQMEMKKVYRVSFLKKEL